MIPSAWMIGSIVIKSSLVILVISIIFAIFTFRWTSPFQKNETKKHLDEVTTILIVLVFAIIFGKIILHLSIFIKDPFAILAYPSDSNAFYIGILLTVLYVNWNVVKGWDQFEALFFTFLNVFLLSSFIYEFVLLVWSNVESNLSNIVLLFVLVFLLFLLQGKISIFTLGFSAFLVWSGGNLLLSLIVKTNIYQFYVDTWFYAIWLILGVIIVFMKRLRDIS